ncbi:MAG: hypothetical protein ACPG8W_15850 [Candidatus Promineifilaceae bacterium]
MTRDTLERKLDDCETAVETILRRLVDVPHSKLAGDDLDRQYRAAKQNAAKVRRQLAELTGDEHAVWLDLGVTPEAAVSGGMLIQTEEKCYLLFNISGPPVANCIPQAIVEFDAPLKTQFGVPNDEALDGHPLSDSGLGAYDAFEVINSRWLAEERRRNQVVFPDSKFMYRHFIFTFHDSTFECLANDLTITVDTRSFEQIWQDFFPKIL